METGTHRSTAYPVAFGVFLVLTIAFVIFTIWAHGNLPDRVPVHFDLEGNVNRTAEKSEFLFVNLSVALLLFFSFGLIGWLAKRIPVRFVNLPNKEYWLAPERRKESMQRFQVWYLWMGTLTVAFLFYVAWQAYRVGMEQTKTLQFGWIELSLYFVAFTALCIQLYRSFSKPSAEAG